MTGLYAVSISPHWAVWGHEIDGFWMLNSLAVYFLIFLCFLLQLFHHSYFLCSCTSVIKLSWCSLPVTCLAVFLSISRFSYPLIFCCLFLSLAPTHSTCMLGFSLSSSSVTMQPETLSKSPVGKFGHQAAVWCQHMYCILWLWCQVSVRLNWMPRHFVLPVAINSRIITRLNTSHLYLHGSYFIVSLVLIILIPFLSGWEENNLTFPKHRPCLEMWDL